MNKEEQISKRMQEIIDKLFPLIDELSEYGNKYDTDFGYGSISLKFKMKASKYNELDEYEKDEMEALTKKQYLYYNYYCEYIKKNGYAPTYEYMSNYFKKSVSSIHGAISKSKSKGYNLHEINQYHALGKKILNNK